MHPERPRVFGEISELQARRRPEAIAIACEGRALTYAELHTRGRQAAGVLRELGVQPGERVAWLARNCETFFEVLFGTSEVRACLAPFNIRLAAPEIAAILKDSEAKVLFVGPEFVDLGRTLARDLGGIVLVAILGSSEGLVSYERLRDRAEPSRSEPPRPEDDLLQLYTSGTTGLPKGVRLTHANYAAFLEVGPLVEGFDYGPADVVYDVMPLFHVAGVNTAITALASGCRLIIGADFSPSAALALIQTERVTRAFLVPAMIQMMLQAPDIDACDLSSLRSVAYGASPISEAVLTAARRAFGCDFIQFYGMTESTGGGTLLSPSDHVPEKLRSCGTPWPGHEIRICGAEGPEGPEAPQGAVGEIAIKGPTVMTGYWRRPEATASSVRDGWLLTGDAGYRDAEGYVYIHDRVKDMIVTGGENVYPAEVENAILGCPGVADVAVIGVPSEAWGEEVKALVVKAEGAPIEAAEVIAWARARIAGYKTPKTVEFRGPLPRNASGKILRRELRAPFWEGRDRLVS